MSPANQDALNRQAAMPRPGEGVIPRPVDEWSPDELYTEEQPLPPMTEKEQWEEDQYNAVAPFELTDSKTKEKTKGDKILAEAGKQPVIQNLINNKADDIRKDGKDPEEFRDFLQQEEDAYYQGVIDASEDNVDKTKYDGHPMYHAGARQMGGSPKSPEQKRNTAKEQADKEQTERDETRKTAGASRESAQEWLSDPNSVDLDTEKGKYTIKGDETSGYGFTTPDGEDMWPGGVIDKASREDVVSGILDDAYGKEEQKPEKEPEQQIGQLGKNPSGKPVIGTNSGRSYIDNGIQNQTANESGGYDTAEQLYDSGKHQFLTTDEIAEFKRQRVK